MTQHTHLHDHDHDHSHPHTHGGLDNFYDYMEAVNAYRKTFAKKEDVIRETPDPATREMLLHLEEAGVETVFDRFDQQQLRLSRCLLPELLHGSLQNYKEKPKRRLRRRCRPDCSKKYAAGSGIRHSGPRRTRQREYLGTEVGRRGQAAAANSGGI